MSGERTTSVVERLIIGIMLAAIAWGPLATGAVRRQDLAVVQVLVVLGLAVWLLRLWTARRYRLLWPPICWSVLAFVGYAVVRTIQADLHYVAEGELTRILVYAGVFFLIINNTQERDAFDWLVYLFAALGSIMSAYAIFQFVTDSDRVWTFIRPASYAGRGSATYICPNHFAGFLVMTLPLVSSVAIWGRKRIVPRILLGYSAVLMLAGLAISISRGGWIACVAALVTLAFVQRTRQRAVWRAWLVIAALSLTALLAVNTSSRVRQRVQALFEDQYIGGALDLRRSLWASTVKMWQDHPWQGVGPGHFDYRFPAYRLSSVQARPGYAHNDYLNTLADWGAAGFLLVLIPFALAFHTVNRLSNYLRRANDMAGSRSGGRWPAIAGAACGLVGLLVHSFVDFNMQIPGNAVVAVALLASISSYARYSTDRYWVRRRWWIRWPATIFVVAIITFLSMRSWINLQESRYLVQASKEKTQSSTRIAALRGASGIRPSNFETTFALGEAHRQLSWEGGDTYTAEAEEAIEWYRLAADVNPFDPFNPARIGMCLDWLGRHEEALPFFEQALELDPRNLQMHVFRGWHELQTGNYQEALQWFYRAVQIRIWPNPVARRYVNYTKRLIQEQRREQSQKRAGAP